MGLAGAQDTAGAVRSPRSPFLTSRRHIDLLRVCSAASRHRSRGTGSAD
ncbi:putative leader peptide [Streptomyces sp. Je 1-79]